MTDRAARVSFAALRPHAYAGTPSFLKIIIEKALEMVTSGRHDEATPLIAETVHTGIPGSEWVIFEESSHMAHAEEPERYMQVLDDFLTRVEERVAAGD